MPEQPTREQFDAAAKKVMASAPAGLSRDQFFALVDKELTPAVDPLAANMGTKTFETNSGGEKEPDTWRGGFIRGLRREFVDPLLQSPMAKGAAHPQTAADILGLLVPSAIGMGSAKEFPLAAKNLAEGAAEGAANKEGLKKIPAVVKGMWKRATTRNPDVTIANAERKMYSEGHVRPDTTSVPDGGIPMEEMPQSTASMVETPQDTLLRRGSVPTEAPQGTSHVPYGGVEVPHKIKKTRMGAEVANPFGKDEALHQNLMERMGMKEMPDGMFPARAGTAAEDVGAGGAKLASEGASPAEGLVSSAPNKPKMSAAEVAAALRREYGSRDAGSMLYGDSMSPAERAAAVKRLAPGPSQVPLAAERRIEEAARKARGVPGDDDLLSILTAMMAGGGATALSSRTTVPTSTGTPP